MPSFNLVVLAGNLTRDPELRHLPSGNAVTKLALAINRNWTTEDGQKREEVTFVDVDAFGKQAETIAKYFSKGRGILVEGRLKLDQWEDRATAQKKSRLGVVLDSFSFLEAGRGDSTPAPTATNKPAAVPGQIPF